MIIRQVESKDLGQCYNLETQTFPAHVAASKDTIKRRLDWYPQGFLVAEIDGAVVGMVNSGATDKEDISDERFKQLVGHNPRGKHLVLFSLSVLPMYQGKGIARYLLNAIHQRAYELKKKKILLHCLEPLVAYYEQIGFTNQGAAASNFGGESWYIMAKEVDEAEIRANMA